VVLVRRHLARRPIHHIAHTRQAHAVALCHEHHLVARNAGQMAREVHVLAGEVLVDKQDLHLDTDAAFAADRWSG
jgi:hypothetical protein